MKVQVFVIINMYIAVSFSQWLFSKYMAIFTSSGHTNGDEAPSSSQRRSFSDKIKNKDRGTPSWETKASDSTVQNNEKIDRQSHSRNNNFVRVEKRRPLIPLMRSSGSDGNVDSSSSGSGELVEVRNKRLTARSYRASLNRMAERFENTGTSFILLKATYMIPEPKYHVNFLSELRIVPLDMLSC